MLTVHAQRRRADEDGVDLLVGEAEKAKPRRVPISRSETPHSPIDVVTPNERELVGA